jgi:ATP-binding protein involved in chromosome partitioning
VALLDVRKSISMLQKVKVPILGVVENMSGFLCPHCGKSTEIFDKGGGLRAAEALKIPFLGEIPLVSEVREGSDTGHPIVLTDPNSPAAQALTGAAKQLAARLSILAAQEALHPPPVWNV